MKHIVKLIGMLCISIWCSFGSLTEGCDDLGGQDQGRMLSLPSEIECARILHLFSKLKPKMSEREVLVALGLGKYQNTLMDQARVEGGIGVGDIRTEYLSHIHGYSLSMTKKINGPTTLQYIDKYKNMISKIVLIEDEKNKAQ